MPPPESLKKVGQEVVSFYEAGTSGESPPYLLYVYRPKDEYPVRRDLQDLKLWLEKHGIACMAISLAELFWRAIEESGYKKAIFAEEEARQGAPEALNDVHVSINQILTGPPSLSDRVIDALKGAPEPCVAFLYRAGALYPCYRTSAILDDLRERLFLPVVLLYPGRLIGSFGLSFMDKLPPAHGYRAKIIPREGTS